MGQLWPCCVNNITTAITITSTAAAAAAAATTTTTTTTTNTNTNTNTNANANANTNANTTQVHFGTMWIIGLCSLHDLLSVDDGLKHICNTFNLTNNWK